LEETPKAIRRINKLLKPGGMFISKTPCLADQSKLLRGFMGAVIYLLQKLGIAPHYVKFFSVNELEELITNENFRIIETGEYPPSHPRRFIVVR